MNKRLFRFKMFEHFQEEKENNMKTSESAFFCSVQDREPWGQRLLPSGGDLY